MSKFYHPLMYNNFSNSDFNTLIKFLKRKPILTQNRNVKIFEKKWSKWLGVKYSLFVNSGSSANFLTLAVLSEISKKTKRNQIIVPALTWVSDIVSVIKNNFEPVFVDINLNNLSMNIDHVLKKINKKTLAIFITHAQGFNGLNEKLLNKIKKEKIILIEDVCESHGAKYKEKKLGTLGLISNFSFYYAHHMSTIEGGMVCTNNKQIYEICRMMRGHGMLREVMDKSYEKKIIKKYKYLSPKFIFMYPGFNFRNNEIGAVLGINQLKRLDSGIKKRNRNLLFFLKNLDDKKFFTDFNLEGISNYAFPVILNTKNIKLRDSFEKYLEEHGIEFRRGNAGGGNQLRQPYLQKYIKNINFKKFPNVEHVHNFGYYIGNYPSLSKSKILKICKIINSI